MDGEFMSMHLGKNMMDALLKDWYMAMEDIIF